MTLKVCKHINAFKGHRHTALPKANPRIKVFRAWNQSILDERAAKHQTILIFGAIQDAGLHVRRKDIATKLANEGVAIGFEVGEDKAIALGFLLG